MRYLISGGGTGGHIYPAISILDGIKEKDKDAEILYVGTQNGLEKELATKAGYNYKAVRIQGLPRRLNLDSIKTALVLVAGLIDANKILNEFKPDIVIGTGGYVCFPVVYLAQKRGIKTMLQEANAFPGKVNRILSKKVDAVAIAFDEAKKRLKAKYCFNSGNPIRPEFKKIDREASRRQLRLKKDEKFVLSFGGSGGQESINDAVIEMLKNSKLDYSFVHITGRDHYSIFMDRIKSENIELADNIKILDYSHEIPKYLSAADIVILSSSAISLAEVAVVGAPSILIPKAYTADNHQEFNARSFENAGASKMILEKDLDGKSLEKTIKSILDDESLMQKMKKCAKILAKPNSTEMIVENIFMLLKWVYD